MHQTGGYTIGFRDRDRPLLLKPKKSMRKGRAGDLDGNEAVLGFANQEEDFPFFQVTTESTFPALCCCKYGDNTH